MFQCWPPTSTWISKWAEKVHTMVSRCRTQIWIYSMRKRPIPRRFTNPWARLSIRWDITIVVYKEHWLLLSRMQTSVTSVIQLEDGLLDPQSEMVVLWDLPSFSPGCLYWSKGELWNSSVQIHLIYVRLLNQLMFSCKYGSCNLLHVQWIKLQSKNTNEEEIKIIRSTIFCSVHKIDLFISFIIVRVAKRAKVMFSQACVTHSVQLQGGRAGGQHQRLTPPPLDNTSLPSLLDNTSLPPSPLPGQHLPPSLPRVKGLNTSPPPGQHLPTSLPPGSKVTTPPPQDYAQADGTHPTGMHSCWLIFVVIAEVQKIFSIWKLWQENWLNLDVSAL